MKCSHRESRVFNSSAHHWGWVSELRVAGKMVAAMGMSGAMLGVRRRTASKQISEYKWSKTGIQEVWQRNDWFGYMGQEKVTSEL